MATDGTSRPDSALRSWLSELGLEQYAASFEQNDIDLEVLADLADAELEKLGVTLGHRKRLLKSFRDKPGASSDDLSSKAAADSDRALLTTAGPERRQLTLLFCDLVGSTELSQRLDPEDYRELVRAYQSACSNAIAKYDGYIAQYLGDGLLAYFGFPRAHEDDAERAARAGMSIVDAVTDLRSASGPLQVRVGIHTGLVVVGEVGAGASSEQLALGETPNVAARLQALAEPNTVVMSAATERLVEGLFRLLPLGPRPLKGVAQPVEVYRVTGASTAGTALDARGRLTTLVGRDQDLGLLLDRWERASEGQGQVVLLTGEPGIGKSRLVRAMRERLVGTDQRWAETRCSPYFTQTPLYPIVEALPRLLGWTQQDAPETELRKLEDTIAACGIDPAEAVPLLAMLLSRRAPPQRPLPPMSPARERRRTLETIVALLLALGGKRPLLIAIEDLHWVDPTTLELVGQLVEQTPTGNILLVLTARPEFTPPWGSRSYVTALTLNRLTRRQTERVVAQLAGDAALPKELAQQIVERTDGVPLFVEELTKAVLESGIVEQVGGSYRLTGASTALAIPVTLQDSLMARLDRMNTAKDVAQLASAIGRTFRYPWLRAVTALDEPALQRALRQLVDAELLFQRGQPPDATYTFKHALIQDAAYQSMLKSKRQQHHRLIAQTIAEHFPEEAEARPEFVAHHFAEAGLWQEAARYWSRAGERAVQRSANVEATAHLRSGLAVVAQSPAGLDRDRIEAHIQVALGSAAIGARGYADAEVSRAFGRARELAEQLQDAELDVVAKSGLWVFHLVRGELDLAQDIAENCLRLAQGLSRESMIESLLMVGCNAFWLGNVSFARENFESSLINLDQRSDPTPMMWLYQEVGVGNRVWLTVTLWTLGLADQSIVRGEEGLRLAEALQQSFSRAFMLVQAAWVRSLRRDWALAERLAGECIERSEDQGFPFFLALATIHRGQALFHLGQERSGLSMFKDGIGALRSMGDRVGVPYFEGTLAEAVAASGQPEEGLRMVDEAIAQVSRNSSHWCNSDLRRVRGEILLRLPVPDMSGAEACFLDAIRIARAQQAKAFELRAALALARLWKQQTKGSEARQVLTPVYDWFTEGSDMPDLKDAKALLEQLGRRAQVGDSPEKSS